MGITNVSNGKSDFQPYTRSLAIVPFDSDASNNNALS